MILNIDPWKILQPRKKVTKITESKAQALCGLFQCHCTRESRNILREVVAQQLPMQMMVPRFIVNFYICAVTESTLKPEHRGNKNTADCPDIMMQAQN
jgi:hypothetical protein